MNLAAVERRLARLEAITAREPAPTTIDGGRRALAGLGVDLSALSGDELDRLEILAMGWPDGSLIPPMAVWACLGR